MALEYKTYEVTLAWRNNDTGELEPEFTSTKTAWSEDEAVEMVRAELRAQDSENPSGLWHYGHIEAELRGIKELVS